MQTNVLEQAERFIAGFEDDATQEGIEQLLADLRQATLRRKDMLRKLDSLELRGFGPNKRICFHGDEDTVTLSITDSLGNGDRLYQRLQCPPEWEARHWNPAHWRLHQDRIDNLGRSWSRCAETFVVDNFGELVEVSA